ncbi:PAS domain-containing protein [Emticicia sp. W12TSBA100-4]|uniref:PAS domain-containing sensor histidine kinase n=1 Tax=Emticicia sp. W12TSBA100-4 TaxID=3160965 RepID=UPI0033067EAA
MDNPKISCSAFGLSLIAKQIEGLVKILPQLIYVYDLKLRKIVFISDRITDILGYSKQDVEAMGNSIAPIMVHTNAAAFAKDTLERFDAMIFGEKYDFTLAFRHKNGEVRTLKYSASLLQQNDKGENTFVMLIGEDVTEQILRQEILEFRDLYNDDAERVFQYGSWEMTETSDYVKWTDGLFELLGIAKEQFPNNRVPRGFYYNFVPASERESLRAEVNSIIASRTPYHEITHPVISIDGQTKYVFLRMQIFVNNNVTVIMGSVVDNTHKIKAEKALNDQMLQLQRQHTQMEEAESIFKFGSWEFSINESNFRCSEGMFKLLELDSHLYPQSIVSLDFYTSFVHPEDIQAVRDYTLKVLAEQRPFYEIEHRVIDSTGLVKNVMLRARVQYDEGGGILRAIGVTADLTEIETYRRELERQVAALNRSNQELEQFAYVASHDLQEPLRKIKAFGERLEKKYKDVVGEEGKFFIDRMINASQRMNTLIDDLLTYSRASREIENRKEISLNDIVKNVIEDLEIKIQNESAQIIVGDLPVIEAQAVKMQQLFQNLIENALKFKKAEVSPIVKISAEKVKKVECLKALHLNPLLEYFQFTISDNGIGFDSKYAESIFAIFQRLHGRTEYEGTGLGLAICRKIVETHGGCITAKGEEGIGATFIFYLPTTKK